MKGLIKGLWCRTSDTTLVCRGASSHVESAWEAMNVCLRLSGIISLVGGGGRGCGGDFLVFLEDLLPFNLAGPSYRFVVCVHVYVAASIMGIIGLLA